MERPPRYHVARYRIGADVRVGWIDDDRLVRLSAPPWERGVETGERDFLADARLLTPVRPGKIVCVGLNYRAHIAESASVAPDATPSEPILFLKPPSALLDLEEPIRYPPGVTRLDPEAELAVVLGQRARRVSREDAPRFVAGVTALNDVSARNFQKQDGQWTRAKGFDTFAPLGPWITVGLSPERLSIVCRVNGEERQRGNTADLLFPVADLVSFVSHVMTLEPGDVIATGTPAGVQPIQIGDRVEVEVEGVGVLRNPVAAPDA
ncbi:MAG: fumarylacetoacetate hydrolase family protein [Candidatus Eisenbacteria bacterium]|uniref:Fumarylacetoacetate hydrolase family protein n=1 Tax=Eiseniibacteriota bacterium TaxID=2212470 RepID=A0A538U2A0_UNCEI|nr:MAG: fumarylacetoacetate hydrolase family protein [Candidatus Eisenbacteria bacterium]